MNMQAFQRTNDGLQKTITALRAQKNAIKREAQTWKSLALTPAKIKPQSKQYIAETLLKYPLEALGNSVKTSSHILTAIALSIYPSNAFTALIDELKTIDPGIAQYYADFGLNYGVVVKDEYCKFKEMSSKPSRQPMSIVFGNWHSELNSLLASPHVKREITEGVIEQIKEALLRFGELVCLEVANVLSEREITLSQLEKTFPYSPNQD